MRIYSFVLVLLLTSNLCFAQQNEYLLFDWQCSDELIFEGHEFNMSTRYQQLLTYDFSEPIKLVLENELFVPLSECELQKIEGQSLKSEAVLQIQQGIEQHKRKVMVSIFPLKKIDGKWHKLLFTQLKTIKQAPIFSKRSSTTNSVLSQGNWYKIAVNKNGVHQIDYSDLLSLGLDVSSVNPEQIQLFGRPGGMLPLLNSEDRIEDLQELAIEVTGAADGSFDNLDKVLFFGQSPNQWTHDTLTNLFTHQTHYYSDYTYYFLRVNHSDGLRIQNSAIITNNADVFVNSFNDFAVRESEEVNLIKSGRKWYGDAFGFTDNRSFTFSFPNCEAPITLKSVFATSVPSPYSSVYSINGNGSSVNINAQGTIGDYTFASITSSQHEFPATNNLNLSIQFTSSYSGAEGWIDYLELNTRRKLSFSSGQLLFRDTESILSEGIAEYEITGVNSNVIVWEVTNPLSPQKIQANYSVNSLNFKNDCSSLREYIAFDGSYKSVITIGGVSNQNIRSIRNIDMLIVSPTLFSAEAERLAQFHRDYDNMNVEVVDPEKIYNEFSAGAQDVSAIRDFARHLYNQENPLKYLLLFGDASYDPKDRVVNNTNYIVSYQSPNSHSEINSYVSDDFFALLDTEESINSNSVSLPFLDIGVGRFPVKSLGEAKIAVDKVLSYHEGEALGAWRLNVCFVGDDNDVSETVHTAQAEELADDVSAAYPDYNIDKIYLDAYQQESTPGGQRCQQVNQAINERIDKGVFLINFTGHGGELGWTEERILGLDDINTWSNNNKLPLFMTATCEFSRFDDPSRSSAGEEVFLKENAGAIALFSTSRIVFTSGNMDLNQAFLAQLFEKNDDGTRPRVGDLFRKTKNTVSNISSTNHRNFTLLGDPALCLAYPKHQIVLTEVQDSVKALGTVTMSGKVIDENGNLLSNFNGEVYPKVYDKSITYQTLGQDASPVLEFDLQNALIFKGKSSVVNGEFAFEFIVPKDISYNYGNGKVSLYAVGHVNGELTDAAGFNEAFLIGGTSEQFIDDIEGPQISLFINDTLFQKGGLTDENPDLLALVSDETGVNTIGNGIGHDAIAILDENTTNPVVLNDYYESELDSYQAGEIRYPFTELEEGMHTLSVKVWDVFNNSSEAYTEFVVSSSQSLNIENLMNYPNPMANFTEFYFEHNQVNSPMDVSLEIMDMQGRVLKVLEDRVVPDGYRYGPIRWNGKSKDGFHLSSGIYVYKVVATALNGEVLEKSAKLIISK